MGYIVIIIAALLVGYCTYSANTPEAKQLAAMRKADCNTPKLVSEIDGVKLYSVNPDCQYKTVYFSKSGAEYDERHGKTTRHVNVPNSSGGQ